MQFLLIAYDGKDGGFERRLAGRDRHIALGDELVANGDMLFGTATSTATTG